MHSDTTGSNHTDFALSGLSHGEKHPATSVEWLCRWTVPQREPSDVEFCEGCRIDDVAPEALRTASRSPGRGAIRRRGGLTRRHPAHSQLLAAITQLDAGSHTDAARCMNMAIEIHSNTISFTRNATGTQIYHWAAMSWLKTATGEAVAGVQFATHGLRLLRGLKAHEMCDSCRRTMCVVEGDLLASTGAAFLALRQLDRCGTFFGRAAVLHERGRDLTSAACDRFHLAATLAHKGRIVEARSTLLAAQQLLQTADGSARNECLTRLLIHRLEDLGLLAG
jgi:hypothetical protein